MALFEAPVAAVDFIREVAAGVSSSAYEIHAPGLHIGHVDMVEREPVGAAIVITHTGSWSAPSPGRSWCRRPPATFSAATGSQPRRDPS